MTSSLTLLLRLLLPTALLLWIAAGTGFAQNKTIVLVRHAEKVAAPPTEPDPELSPEGRERAQRFMKAVAKRYKPHEIFSTSYKRTRQTAEPVAAKRKKEIQTYDPAKQNGR